MTFNDVADALKVARVDGSTGQVSEISVMFKLVPVSLLEIVSLEPKMSKQILYHLKGSATNGTVHWSGYLAYNLI